MNTLKTLTIIFILFNFTKQRYDCISWSEIKTKTKELFGRRLKWEDIAQEVNQMYQAYYQIDHVTRPSFFRKILKNVTHMIYYPQVDIYVDDQLEYAINFSRQNKDDSTLHFTRLLECAYDNKQGMLIFLDKPYEERFQTKKYTNLLQRYKQQGGNLLEIYYETIKTFDALSSYNIAQMVMDQQFIIQDELVPYIYIDIFVKARIVPINQQFKDPVMNQILKNGAVTREAINYMMTGLMIKYHIYVIHGTFEISEYYSYDISSEEKELERTQVIIDKFIDILSLYYKPNKPNKIKGLFSKVGAKFEQDFSFIYDFEELVRHLFLTTYENRRNFKYLMASLNNCFKYSKILDPYAEYALRQKRKDEQILKYGIRYVI